MARPGTKEREERDEELKNLYVDKEELEDKDSNENLAKMVLINDLERVLLLKEGKMQEAEVVAQKNYEKSKKRKRLLGKSTCDAEMCLIFPIDEECGWDDHFECKNGCKLHIRCEGLAPINEGGHLPHDYQCRSCATELGNERWLEKQLEEELSKLSYSIHENSEGLRRLSMKIDYLENQVS